MRCPLLLIGCGLLLGSMSSVDAADPRPKDTTPASASTSPPATSLAGFFERHCVQCHQGQQAASDLDLTPLTRTPIGGPVDHESIARWIRIHDRIAAGEMPPAAEPRPTLAEIDQALAGLAAPIRQAERATSWAVGRTRLRRLTRVEYELTLRDLLQLPHLAVREMLPGDGQAHGFDNNADALDISHVNLARYVEAADAALDLAIATRPQPPTVQRQRISLACRGGAVSHVLLFGDAVFLKNKAIDPEFPPAGKDHHIDQGAHERLDLYNRDSSVGVFRPEDDAFYPYFFEFGAIYPGQYRLKTSLWSFTWDKGQVLPARQTEAVRLSFVHLQADGRHGGHPNDIIGYFDAPSLSEQVHELTVWLNRKDTIGFNAASLVPNRVSEHQGRLLTFTGPGVACDYLDVEGPIHEVWPPASHRQLFGDLPIEEFDPNDGRGVRYPRRSPARQEVLSINRPDIETGQYTVVSADPIADADRLLTSFLPRAFRRPVPEETRRPYLELVRQRLDQGDCFELAMRTAYRAALCSSDFLYHVEPVSAESRAQLSAQDSSTEVDSLVIDGSALANRLSYFFWNSLPDEQLAVLGRSGQLQQPDVLRSEIARLWADPRSSRFVESFTGQWLKLRSIAATDPDRRLYPEFSVYLQDSMVAETRAYFRELIARNLGIEHIVASDFAMLNGQLARHYRIPGVDGTTIRPVSLPAHSTRGGFLTQASLLKISANGTTTSPVPRGAFVIDRLLGQPPPPPPPNVPAVEPDVRGTTTIREQLAKHRADPACASCHALIDPPGFALEAFDVIGGDRKRYRSLGEGDSPDVSNLDPLLYAYFREGPPVDATGQLADGRPFEDIRGFRSLISGDRAQLLDNLARRLLIYGTSRPISFSDRSELRRIVDDTLAAGGGVRTLVDHVLTSRLFAAR